MITLNMQVGVNPLLNHQPAGLFSHPASPLAYTLGDNGEVVAWKGRTPLFQMCPSLNAEADKLIAIAAANVREVDQVRQGHKLITLHNDNRLRVWAQDDGTCLNVSAPGVFPVEVVALIAPPGECKFIVALAEESLLVVDCWLLKVVGQVAPKKEAYARFRRGHINERLELVIEDGNNRAYDIQLKPLLAEHFLDFGNYINDYLKPTAALDSVIEGLNSAQVLSYYKKPEPQPAPDLSLYREQLRLLAEESLAEVLFCEETLEQHPDLRSIFAGERASTSSLHYVGGAALFLFLGTEEGTLLGVPFSGRTGEPLMLLRDVRRRGSPVMYVRVFEGSLFVSWEDGWLGIYHIHNLVSYLEVVKLGRQPERQARTREVWTTSLSKLAVCEERMSSFVKYSLPVYHSTEGAVRESHFFRLDRNEIIRYEESTTSITHFRGIPEDAKVYCVMLMEEYVGICTGAGVELYSPTQHERTLDYTHWQWADFPFFQLEGQAPEQASGEFRHSDQRVEVGSAHCLLKYGSRWAFDRLDYHADAGAILSETFGEVGPLDNSEFPGYFFLQRGEVRKALHSASAKKHAVVVKLKLNRVRRDSWHNAAYILHGNLNAELESFQAQRGSPRDILLKDFEFYALMPRDQPSIPLLSDQMRNTGRRVLLRGRQTVQGVGKTFTIHLAGGRSGLSERVLCYEGVATVSLLQCWVLKDSSATDHMVEAVEHFAKQTAARFENSGDVLFAKMAVSHSQHISKASINLLISKALTGHFTLHPILEYFILWERVLEDGRRLLTYNETVWLVHLAIGLIFSGHRIESQQLKTIVARLVTVIRDIKNYERKPHYLLTAMRAFNEGVTKWRSFLHELSPSIFSDLFRIFFAYDGLAGVEPDDKKFNFCFAGTEESLRRVMKQGIIKSVIYLGKEFPVEFHGVLKRESVSQKGHLAYPASVVEVVRQFIKSERPQNHLVFFVEMLLQCLSPMTPNLRKYVQRNALSTLQLLCSSYSNVSFNQPSQKLSVKTPHHLYIYCLRTSTIWRTINLKDEQPHPAPPVIEMSPKGTYIALLSDKLRVWRLSSGFWSGVLGAFSQDWVFEAEGTGIRWQDNEQTITVLGADPSQNKSFKV